MTRHSPQSPVQRDGDIGFSLSRLPRAQAPSSPQSGVPLTSTEQPTSRGALSICSTKALIAVAVLVLVAATGRSAVNVDAWELISPTHLDWRERDHRRAIAEDLLVRLDLLADIVPPLSPRQQAQVANQMAELQRMGPAADARRRSRLYMSRRYQHFRLLELLDDTRRNLQCVVAADRINEEMRCWSLASVNFGDEAKLDLALSMLRRARMIPKDGAMPVKAQDPAVWYGEYGRGILKHILTPHLAEQAIKDDPSTGIGTPRR